MIIDNITINFEKYRCFRHTTQFGPIKRANVIIGKNNSGKSALIDVFEILCASASTTAKNDDMGFVIKRGLTAEEKKTVRGINPHYIDQQMRSNKHFLDDIRISFTKEGNKFNFHSCSNDQFYKIIVPAINQSNDFSKYHVLRLNAERDIIPESFKTDNSAWVIPSKGSGITQMIQAILNQKHLKQSIVEDEVLSAFNQITKPDVDIQRIQTKYDVKGSTWEIYLNEEGKGLVPLSQSGSGLKTILAVLVFIHVLPKILRNIDINNLIYAFEELENNLHPAVQRKLYEYIEEKSKEMSFTYFISTHSTVALDYYYGIDEASIFQVNRGENGSSVTTISNNKEVSQLIDDLGQRASDLLQSNCIIWVEGPSDRIYLNRWIELFSKGQIVENKHYTIMFYGGKLLCHLTFELDMEESEIESFICMFKVNRHSIVLIDSDLASDDAMIRVTKSRIKEEVEGTEGLCWVTKGREIENYLSLSALARSGFVGQETGVLHKYSKVMDEISANPPDSLKKHLTSKVSLAKLVAPLLQESDLDVLDLRDRIEQITARIRMWNDV